MSARRIWKPASQPPVSQRPPWENAGAASFTLEVSDLGSYTSFLAAAGVANPAVDGLGTETTKTLVVDGVETTLTLSGNTLDALAKAINDSETGLTANVINVSSTSTPSYKLVLQGDKLGAQTIALKDGDATGADLLESAALNVGSSVLYKVNGVSVSAESRTVTLAPDISVSLSGTTASSGPVSLTVKRSASQIVDRLRGVAAAYNAAAGKLDEHRGQSRGALQGQNVISTLSKVLRDLPSFSGESGSFQNFTDIGLRFDDKGTMTLDSGALSGLSDEKLDQLVAFLGTEKTGGFVGTALGTIGVATTAESGILALERKSYADQGKAEALQVQQMQERMDLMETNLRERFAALDSAIAALQQQALYFNNLFESMRIAQQTYSN
ncbi:MAG: flagellar filament capping protein FliD [Bryobacterales bacterium]|nr:flagellar filament capping protein FliD [Bryobacterales bacterium]